MSKIVFFCIPAHGHTNPTLGVVRELISRGHEVTYYSYEMMREKIEATGATFIPCDEYDHEKKLIPKDGERLGKDLAFSTKILVDTTLALDDAIYKDMLELKPDCIVADSIAVWGKAIALKLNIPFVSSTTTFAFNEHSAKIMKQSLKQLLKMLFSMPKISKDIKRLQSSGFPIKNVLELISNSNDTHTIVYTSQEFQPCSETFSDKYAFVGPSIRPIENELKKTKDKLIYISMGTVVNDALSFYKNCIKALGDTEYQVIMSVGNQVNVDELGETPENITIEKFVDQIAVLSQADVFLTHCGMNSVNEALYHEVPLVMLPQTPEQEGVARRVEQLGAGVFLTNTKPTTIRETVENVLKTPSYREQVENISKGFKQCTGAKGAADKIESMLHQ